MLRTRVITAVILLAVLLAVLYVNSFPLLALAVAAFCFAATWEGGRLFGAKFPLAGAAVWTAVLLFLAFHDSAMWPNPHPVQDPSVMLAAISAAIWAARLAPSLAIGLPPLKTVGNWLLSAIYGAAVLACFAAILALFRHSALYLVSVMALVWLADIGAYFSGKAFGKRKLAPSISPGKSWEGAAASLAASLIFGFFFLRWAIPTVAPAFALALTAVANVAGQFGDLCESALKRGAGVKDSGTLLPGHGGWLDRVDSTLFTLPVVYSYVAAHL